MEGGRTGVAARRRRQHAVCLAVTWSVGTVSPHSSSSWQASNTSQLASACVASAAAPFPAPPSSRSADGLAACAVVGGLGLRNAGGHRGTPDRSGQREAHVGGYGATAS
eukprot:SAG22_NODE_2289_length_2753_cov_11.769028_6_plen_109_part_00